MIQYHDLLEKILEKGVSKPDRTGTGTLSIFGYQMRFDLEAGFPMLTTRKIFWKNVLSETIFFLEGRTNIKYLHKNNVHIWDEWADENGELGRIYGVQWRSWRGANGQTYDQIADVISQIKKNPQSRRLIVSAWNVAEISEMALPPCHTLFQFYVSGNKLSCQLYQRSGDAFVGIPYNIASYALITHYIAAQTGLEVGEFVHTLGDAHIYINHVEAAKELLKRAEFPLPSLVLSKELKDSYLLNYYSHGHIKVDIAV